MTSSSPSPTVHFSYQAPGSWLGVLGGGQLGRMFVHAAQMMGYRVCVLDPAADCPAAQAADEHIAAAYDNPVALDQLANRVEAVTTEFENVLAESLRRLAQRIPVAPQADAVAIAQDRHAEKAFFVRHGLPVGAHQAIGESFPELEAKLFPAIIKTARLGYDGKGQATVHSAAEARDAWERFGRVPCMLEKRIDLALEVSVIVARNAAGDMAVFPLQENQHRNGILDLTIVPARVDVALADRALSLAQRTADALSYVGVLCIEMFVSKSGELLLNEMAPRPHNSGHYTIEACTTSQFAQQVRAMVGAPMGDTRLLTPAVMVNVLGDAWAQCTPDWAQVLAIPGAHVHLYGKAEAKPGRKMGHVTCTAASLDEAIACATHVKRVLHIPA
jgi:5-(carboxyamino)imidazole ribonucleotide synthase